MAFAILAITYLFGSKVTLEVCGLDVFFSKLIKPLDNSILSNNKHNISASNRINYWLSASVYDDLAHFTIKSTNLKKVKNLPITLLVICDPDPKIMSYPQEK